MVDIEIVEEDKNKIQFKVKGETHTILNLIRNELFNDDSVEFAGYRIEHPLTGIAIFTVATSKGSPKTAIKKAIERLQKKLSGLEAEFKKL
jgi:DNA-directed RNA polymerase subunit L